MKYLETSVKPIKIACLSLGVNITLALVKIVASVVSHSQALLSDGIHSCADVIINIMVITTIVLSIKTKRSSISSITCYIIGSSLGITGIALCINGISNILHGTYSGTVPNVLAVSVAIFSICVKLLVYRYILYKAKLCKSKVLYADAVHHKTDSISSVGSLIGTGGAMLGLSFLDSLASIVISVFIVLSAISIVRGNLE